MVPQSEKKRNLYFCIRAAIAVCWFLAPAPRGPSLQVRRHRPCAHPSQPCSQHLRLITRICQQVRCREKSISLIAGHSGACRGIHGVLWLAAFVYIMSVCMSACVNDLNFMQGSLLVYETKGCKWASSVTLQAKISPLKIKKQRLWSGILCLKRKISWENLVACLSPKILPRCHFLIHHSPTPSLCRCSS